MQHTHRLAGIAALLVGVILQELLYGPVGAANVFLARALRLGQDLLEGA